ncbi:18615_t:CDS:2 [Racocetra fulgida]|uniref:18615_t:CDS:1 n=1 Tax=Racocetra fulgida TaxID=60492 RepID=A0A9N9B9J1_9GLOM|nr:18615_t:CDS:2 [Racocetra fulgida]
MDNGLYRDCVVEKCKYWDLDVEFANSTEMAGSLTESVTLKTISNSIDPISDLLKEIESNMEVADDPHFIRCLVMEYATLGSLRAYMNANYIDVDKKVLPYVAPKILCGEEYTKASDVYSFGIVAWKLITGYPPYHNIPHDSGLALQICRGKRPKIPSNIPKIITRLI